MKPKLPAYDRERDGHVFRWIIRTAAEVRAQRREEHAREYVRILERRLQGMPRGRPDER